MVPSTLVTIRITSPLSHSICLNSSACNNLLYLMSSHLLFSRYLSDVFYGIATSIILTSLSNIIISGLSSSIPLFNEHSFQTLPVKCACTNSFSDLVNNIIVSISNEVFVERIYVHRLQFVFSCIICITSVVCLVHLLFC